MVRRYQKRYRSNLYKKSTRSKKPKLLSVPEQIHQEITALKSELRELRKKTFSAPETVSNKVQSLNVSKKQDEAWIEKNKNLYLKKKARIEEINEELKRKNFISRTLFSEELNKEKEKLTIQTCSYEERLKQVGEVILNISELEQAKREWALHSQKIEKLKVNLKNLEEAHVHQLAFAKQQAALKKQKKLEREKEKERLELEKKKREELKAAKAAAYDEKQREQASSVRKTLFSQLKKSKFCPYCYQLINKENVHADHIHPVSKGGLSTKTNMVLVCSTCNLAKRNHTLRSFCSRCGFDFETVVARLMSLGKDV